MLLSKTIAAELVGLVEEVRISVDALNGRNDIMRGKGSFDGAIRALAVLVEYGFEPKALITVTRPTLQDLPVLLMELIRIGVTRINVNPFKAIGRGKKHDDWSVPPTEICSVLESALNGIHHSGLTAAVELEQSQSHCGVGHYLNIMPNGDVFPCHVLTQSEFLLGNVRRHSLREMCGPQTLLSDLVNIRFETVATEEPKAAALLQSRQCMGGIYSATRISEVWKANLPNLPVIQGD